MSGFDRLERDLAVWFEDTAVPQVPDYVDDIVREAVRGRQRPRWSFVGRWLPARVAGLSLPSAPVQWRPVAALVILALLLAALVAFVGSQRRVPPPFGPAENGLVAFSRDGDILTVDPVSRVETSVATGRENDLDPSYSLDGTRIAFVRRSTTGDLIGFVDRDGGRPIFSDRSLAEVDTDSIAWSPDGRGVAVSDQLVYYFIDADTGRVSPLPLQYPDSDVVWRPPDGRELVYRSTRNRGPGILLFSFETGRTTTLVPETSGQLRPRSWSPDGKRLVYHVTLGGDRPGKTFVFEMDSRGTTLIDASAGRLSNDGTRIAGYVFRGLVGRLCVAPADGSGPCTPAGTNDHEADITHSDALNWSPNDEWIIVYTLANEVILIDPEGDEEDVLIRGDGAASWQRLAQP